MFSGPPADASQRSSSGSLAGFLNDRVAHGMFTPDVPGPGGSYSGYSSLSTISNHEATHTRRSFGLGSASKSPIAQLKLLENRAYVSPVKLRQLSRNIPDLQTRMKLRQLQARVLNQKSAAAPADQEKLKESAKGKELERKEITLAKAAAMAQMNRHHRR